MKCIGVGDANPDIAGVGILLSFSIQALIAVVVSFFLAYIEAKCVTGVKAIAQNRPHQPDLQMKVDAWSKKQVICREILLQGCDVQIVTGFALLLSAIIQYRTLSMYHLHVIYDTISFVAVTICAAAICSFTKTTRYASVRYTLIGLWFLLYLVYVILFGIRLRSWNDSLEGHCYSPQGLARPQDSHPKVDNIYISITSVYLLFSGYLCLVVATIDRRASGHSLRSAFSVLVLAMLQLPLHAYSIITLRASNEKLLKSGSVEQQWGFGQIAAMLLLSGNLPVLFNGCQDYMKWKAKKMTDDEEATPNATRPSLELDEMSLQEH